jgi:hypothetical protein
MSERTYPQESARGAGSKDRPCGAEPSREVFVVTEVDEHNAPVYSPAELTQGDRAEARRQLALDLLSRGSSPRMVGVIDVHALPLHVFCVFGYRDRDNGAIDLTEFAEHFSTPAGRGAIDAIVRVQLLREAEPRSNTEKGNDDVL